LTLPAAAQDAPSQPETTTAAAERTSVTAEHSRWRPSIRWRRKPGSPSCAIAEAQERALDALPGRGTISAHAT
jgi:hypothetical protein